jgi:hypothetical protein
VGPLGGSTFIGKSKSSVNVGCDDGCGVAVLGIHVARCVRDTSNPSCCCSGCLNDQVVNDPFVGSKDDGYIVSN